MTIWLLEPRDPLIVREGRPFGSSPGAYATSLPFPFPSTMAGGARARSALDADGVFKYDRRDDKDKPEIKKLKEMSIRGPLLVQLTDEGDVIDTWLAPIPSDVQFFKVDSKAADASKGESKDTDTSKGKSKDTDASKNESENSDTDEKKVLLRRLVPLDSQITFDEQELTSDEQESKKQKHLKGLHLVGLSPTAPTPATHKPHSHKQHYWYWKQFETWLSNPKELTKDDGQLLSLLGREDLTRDHRMHVSIDSTRDVGKDGLLFGTSGLEFTAPGEGGERLHGARRLALAIEVDDQTTPQAGVASFGGERRLVTWRRSDAHFPSCPDDIKDAIKKDGHCRLVLLTPASFKHGYYPSTNLAKNTGVTVAIEAIAVHRPQVVSGWDLQLGKPKPSRRLAPAGTVLFLSIKGNADERAKWIEEIWMKCISDEEQDCRDGFGLAALGTWSGELAPMDGGK